MVYLPCITIIIIDTTGINPLDNLSVAELRKELTHRGQTVGLKSKKQELSEQFDNLRQGLNDVPALLQPTPNAKLEDMNLEKYEISPSEPLHDIKGHLSNVVEEAISIEALAKLKNVKKAILSKDTLRCSDYRKAIIVTYMVLDKINSTSPLTELLRTAVEINEILYATPDKRNRMQTLRLHNATFVHGMLGRELFATPAHITRARMFGRYYHSIVYHTPLLQRLIAPSS